LICRFSGSPHLPNAQPRLDSLLSFAPNGLRQSRNIGRDPRWIRRRGTMQVSVRVTRRIHDSRAVRSHPQFNSFRAQPQKITRLLVRPDERFHFAPQGSIIPASRGKKLVARAQRLFYCTREEAFGTVVHGAVFSIPCSVFSGCLFGST
jgi:hypothetical protein